MQYSIGEFSKLTKLGIHTLRYYEQEGLLLPERNKSNRRCYSDNDLAWVEFIKRLKDTGMSIKDIQQYAVLRAKGDCTLQQRMEMLIAHRKNLLEQIMNLQEHKTKLDEKINFYQQEIAYTANND